MPNYTAVYIIKRETTAFTCLDLLKHFDTKNSITPAGVTSNGQKSPKIFFFIFGIRLTQFAKKSKKKFLTQIWSWNVWNVAQNGVKMIYPVGESYIV